MNHKLIQYSNFDSDNIMLISFEKFKKVKVPQEFPSFYFNNCHVHKWAKKLFRTPDNRMFKHGNAWGGPGLSMCIDDVKVMYMYDISEDNAEMLANSPKLSAKLLFRTLQKNIEIAHQIKKGKQV